MNADILKDIFPLSESEQIFKRIFNNNPNCYKQEEFTIKNYDVLNEIVLSLYKEWNGNRPYKSIILNISIMNFFINLLREIDNEMTYSYLTNYEPSEKISYIINYLEKNYMNIIGVVGAVFDSEITTEFIADGIHVEYPALRIALKQKGTDKIILVTDAMMGCTMPDDQYSLGGQEVWLSNRMAKLKDGAFAGTLLTLDEAVKNLKEYTDCPLHEIVKMATYNPAHFCGVESHKGKIEVGYDADIILFDENIEIKKVIINGKVIENDRCRKPVNDAVDAINFNT